MRKVTSDNLTEPLLGYFGDDTNPRFKKVLASVAKHLYPFALDSKLTREERRLGFDVLHRTEKITTDERDEFVLLSDALGLISLVDMINTQERGIRSSVLGPFHIFNPPAMEMGNDLNGQYDGELALSKQ